MPNIARDVHSAQPPRMLVVVRSASDAILVFMATPQKLVNVPPANPVAFKTSKGKPRVLGVQSARRPTAKQRRVKTLLGALAKLVKSTCMTWDLETNGRAKRALLVLSATQIPAGPPCKSWKAIGSYLGTRNKSHPLPNARFPLALPATFPIVPRVPWVWSVAFVRQIFIALQRVLATLVRPLPPRHERGPWSL